MNKNELIEAISEKLGHVDNNIIKNVVDKFLEVLSDCARNGDKLSIVGYLSMSVSKRKARKCKSPKDGAMIDVPECNVVKFKAGQRLKDAAQ